MAKNMVLLFAFASLLSCNNRDIEQALATQENKVVTLNSTEQKTNHYDCDGNLLKTTSQVIESDLLDIEILALAGSRDLYSATYKNVGIDQTEDCDPYHRNMRFKISLVDHRCALKVTPGTNTIAYSFKYCLDWVGKSGDSDCKEEPLENERGLLDIYIKTNTEYLETALSSKPTNC